MCEASPKLVPGARVILVGLEEGLNGLQGVADECDESDGRWQVELDDGYGLLLAPQHLEVMQPRTSLAGGNLATGQVVHIVDSEVLPDCIGRSGVLLQYLPPAMDETEGRWRVQLEGQSDAKLFPVGDLESVEGPMRRKAGKKPPQEASSSLDSTNIEKAILVLAPGQRARVHGLPARPDLNGQFGQVERWNEAEKRWEVTLDSGGRSKLVLPENLEPVYMKESLRLSSAHTSADKINLSPYFTPPSRDISSDAVPLSFDVGDDVQADITPGAHVRVVDRQACQDSFGTVSSWDEAKSAWSVAMNSGGVELHSAEHLLLCTPNDNCINSTAAGTALGVGTRVRIAGIRGRQELNGQEGIITMWDVSTGRWKLRMDDGSGKLIRPNNLEFLRAAPEAEGDSQDDQAQSQIQQSWTPDSQWIRTGVLVRISDPPDQPNLRGMVATVVRSEPGPAAAWTVMTADGDLACLEAEHLQPCGTDSLGTSDVLGASMIEGASSQGANVQIGSLVRVTGVRGSQQLNGQVGRVIEWDESTSRWKVLLSDGSCKLLRATNLETACFESEDIDSMMGSVITAAAPPVQRIGSLASSAHSYLACLSPGMHVRMRGSHVRPELQGQCGTLLSWEESEGRWRVIMDRDQTGKLFRAESCEPLPLANVSASFASADSDSSFFVLQALLEVGSKVRICNLRSRPQLNGQLGDIEEYDDRQGRWKVRMRDGSTLMFKSANLQVQAPAQRSLAKKVGMGAAVAAVASGVVAAVAIGAQP